MATQDTRRRLSELEKEVARLVDAVAQMGFSPALAEKLRTAEAERAELTTRVAKAQPGELEQAAAAVLANYRTALMDLKKGLEDHPDRQRTRELLRQMLGTVTLIRDAEGVTWAQMQNPAEQLFAVGGTAFIGGCGGAQPLPETHLLPQVRQARRGDGPGPPRYHSTHACTTGR